MLYICCLTSFALCLQERAKKIQQILEELVKSLNEQYKRYGLRARPPTVLELPFGTCYYPLCCFTFIHHLLVLVA